MGRDKALLPVGARPLVLRPVEALRAAAAARVVVVGGDVRALSGLGLEPVADRHPGEGPLGGLVTALGAVDEPVVVVLACDLLHPAPEAVTAVVDALVRHPDAAWAAPVVDGRRELLCAAYRRDRSTHWSDAFVAGERSLRGPASAVPGVEVAGLDPRWFRDADRPADLPPGHG
ncbi:MAG: NTP transferase domain-containing protein [Acidimicrobiales bacterium]|nr:NTP transferase domain-containing protein [Acidimicrobiales bacterium]